MTFSKEQHVLAQELAVQMKVQKDGTRPIEWMFLSLLDRTATKKPARQGVITG
jgi:hypothetical protein